MEEKKFTKLSALVDQEFTVEEAYGYQWKKWDNEAKRMLISEDYEKDYRKIYTVKTDKGTLDLSQGQLGNMLEATYKKGEANIVGATFHVKSNGKTGIDIRYFINLAFAKTKPATPPLASDDNWADDLSEPVDLSEIGF